MTDDLPKRKNCRLNGYDYSNGGIYFLTQCVKDRSEILWYYGVGDGVLDVPSINYDVAHI